MKFFEAVLARSCLSSRPSAQLGAWGHLFPEDPSRPSLQTGLLGCVHWALGRGDVLCLWLDPSSLQHIYGRHVWNLRHLLIELLWDVASQGSDSKLTQSPTALPTVQYGKSNNAGRFKRK